MALFAYTYHEHKSEVGNYNALDSNAVPQMPAEDDDTLDDEELTALESHPHA